MFCFWKSGGKYIINTGVKQCVPVVVDDNPPNREETEQRRSGIRAPVINVDETEKSPIVKHQKTSK